MPRWLRDYIRYISKVFLPEDWWRWAKDSRTEPEIWTATIWLTMLMGFSLQVPSLEELQRRARSSFQKLLPRGQRAPSADAIGYSLKRTDLASLKALFIGVMQKVRRGKMVPWLGNLRVVAIDGTGLFSSESRFCPQCRVVHHSSGVIIYQHEAVYCQSVGPPPRLIWGMEPLGPGEGEITASLRLIEWLWEKFKHFADVVVADAGFAKAPFINFLLAKGVHVVIRVKDERMHIIQDARGLYREERPSAQWTETGHNCETKVVVWDAEGFESWAGVEEPLRVVKIIEEKKYCRICGGRRREERHQREIIVVTSLPKQQASAQVIREIIHRRWDIENAGFHELKGNWHLDHCYVHQEVAIQAILWLMLLAVNLFWLFLYRNRRSFAQSGYSQREVAEWLRSELLFSKSSLWRYLWNTS